MAGASPSDRRRVWPIALIVGLAGVPAAPAHAQGDTFIRQFIAKHGGCAFELGFVLSGSGIQAPFDKPAAQWTEADLGALARELAVCRDEVRATPNPFIAAEIDRASRDIAHRVPELVHRARAEARRQREQLTARATGAADATKQASDELAQLKSQVEAAENQAINAQVQAKLQMQALQLRKRAASAAVEKAEAETVRLRSEVERQERAVAQAQTNRTAASKPGAEVPTDGQGRTPTTLQPQGSEARAELEAAPAGSVQAEPPGDDHGPSSVRTGEPITIRQGYLACRELQVLDHVETLNDERDAETAADYALDHGCRAVLAGTAVTAMSVSPDHGAACVQQQGEADCLWMPTWSLAGTGR